MRIIVALVSIALLASCAYAAEVGTITYAEGRVDIFSPGSDKGVPARDGVAINVGDSIRTKSSSKAEVTFLDKTVMRVAQNSKVDIIDYQLDANNMRKSAEIKLERGKARTTISKMKDAAEFKIDTPNAKGTVKGSDVFTSFQAGNSSMLVTEGTLSVFNPAHPQNVVSVPAGSAVLVPLEDLPKGPRKYLEMEQKFNEQDTNIPETIAARKGAAIIRGAIANFTGDVKVMTKGSAQPHAAKKGDAVNEGDKIMTGANGIVEISFDNGNALYLKPNTDITILKLVMDSKTGEFENLFQADKGAVKARIEGLKGKSKFEVKTPTAICGARGTIMFVQIGQGGWTTSFFEGGNGYTTNLVSGNTLDVNAGSGAGTGEGGGVNGTGPISDDDRTGMDDGFDPNGGTGDSGGTGGDTGDVGGGTTGGVSGFSNSANDSEDDTFDTDVVDVPFTVSNPESLDQAQEVPHVTEVGDFFYAQAEADKDPALVVLDGGMFDFSPVTIDSPNSMQPDPDDYTTLWAALEGGGSYASIDVSGNYSLTDTAHELLIWTTDELYADYNGTHMTKDGGAYYCVMGGTMDRRSGGSVEAFSLVADGGTIDSTIEMLFIGLYVDPQHNAGVIFGYGGGTSDETKAFTLYGSNEFFVDQLFTAGETAESWFPVLPQDLYKSIYTEGSLSGEGFKRTDFGDGMDMMIKLSDGMSREFKLPDDDRLGWGIWAARFAGAYNGVIPESWDMEIAGTASSNGVVDSAWMQNTMIDNWFDNQVTGTSEGVYVSLNDNGTIRAGSLTKGRVLGNYVDIDPLAEGQPASWQAVACGEWVEVAAYTDGQMSQLMADIADAQPDGFSGLNPNTLVTIAESVGTLNLASETAINNITSVNMNMACYQAIEAVSANNGIWAATISGLYSAAPALNFPVALSGDNGSANLTFTQWNGEGGNWRANVTEGITTGSGSGATREFSGVATGTIGSAGVEGTGFSGAAVGTWEKTSGGPA